MTPLAEIEAGGSVARVAEALAGLGLETPILAVPAFLHAGTACDRDGPRQRGSQTSSRYPARPGVL